MEERKANVLARKGQIDNEFFEKSLIGLARHDLMLLSRFVEENQRTESELINRFQAAWLGVVVSLNSYEYLYGFVQVQAARIFLTRIDEVKITVSREALKDDPSKACQNLPSLYGEEEGSLN
jgi:hypothetical protein